MTGLNLLAENMRRLNAGLRRKIAEESLGAWFGMKPEDVSDTDVERMWAFIGPLLTVEMRPNPNYRPPTFEGAPEDARLFAEQHPDLYQPRVGR